MKTDQTRISKLLLFTCVILGGLLVFSSVIPQVAVRVFVPDAPPVRPAKKHPPRHQSTRSPNPAPPKSRGLETIEPGKAAQTTRPLAPQAAPLEIPSWQKPPEITVPLAQLDDTFTHAFLTWNVQSGENNPAVIAQQLQQLAGYDVYCLNEVSRRSFPLYDAALPDHESVESESGRSDHMMILFDKGKFELLEKKELHQFNNGTHRSPMYVRLKDKKTRTELIVMTNHLARGDERLRQLQAAGLREWARDQPVGIINIGDFNMDYSFKKRRGNVAFTEMLRDSIWNWIPPLPLVDTQWSDNYGKDRYPYSMLDFAFVAGPAKTWNPRCRVIVRPGDFPDNYSTSDHRPVELRLELK